MTQYLVPESNYRLALLVTRVPEHVSASGPIGPDSSGVSFKGEHL